MHHQIVNSWLQLFDITSAQSQTFDTGYNELDDEICIYIWMYWMYCPITLKIHWTYEDKDRVWWVTNSLDMYEYVINTAT